MNPDPRSDFARLCQGRTIGKRTSVLVGGGLPGGQNVVGTNMLEVNGPSEDAMQLGLTLTPPQAAPTAGLVLPSTQDFSGTYDNEMMIIQSPGFHFAQPVAIIEWGIGGVDCKAVVDFHNGLTVNLQASFVRVRATLELFAGTTNAIYQLGCFLGPSHASPGKAQKSLSVGSVAFGTTSTVRPIPRFAKEVQIFNDDPKPADDYSIIFYKDFTAGTVVQRIKFLGAVTTSPYFAGLGQKFLIPGDAFYYAIENSSGASNLNRVGVIFDLAL